MSATERKSHIATEAMGVISGLVLIAIALMIRKNYPMQANILTAIGIGTILVDAYFIKTWFRS